MKKLLSSYKFIVSILLIAFLILSLLLFYHEIGKYKKYESLVIKYSYKYNVDENLVFAILKTESNFNKYAVSKKGAMGISQLLPSTADYIAKMIGFSKEINLFDEETSINLATYYLSYLSKKFSNEIEVVCAYNAGEGRVEKWLLNSQLTTKNIPFKETKNYYKKVKRRKFLYKVIR